MDGRIFDIQRFSVHDGPGIRTLVFLKGCNMSCFWCQNPESQKKETQVMFLANSCKEFDDCISSCPKGAISANKLNKIDFEKCDSCGICVNTCSSGAFKLVGKNFSAKEVFEEIKKDIPYYGETGGVTFSGGEATTQIDFLDTLLGLCLQHNIHTNLETNGLFSFERIENVLRKFHLIYFDLKIFQPETHKKYTGVDNQVIQSNARILSERKFPVRFRIPLVQNISDTKENLRNFIDFLKDIKITEISLLKYHNLYESKLDGIGRSSEKLGITSYSDSDFDKAKQLFEEYQIRVL